jgi:hypothetical protein
MPLRKGIILFYQVGIAVGGKRRIFNFFESAPTKAFCKPLKTETFPLSLSLKNSKKPKTWFGTRWSATCVSHAGPIFEGKREGEGYPLGHLLGLDNVASRLPPRPEPKNYTQIKVNAASQKGYYGEEL